MENVRKLIADMISAMVQRAEHEKYEKDRLRDVYRKTFNKNQRRVSFSPEDRTTYDHLFGFGGNSRAYLSPNEFRSRRNDIKFRHIRAIQTALVELEVLSRDEIESETAPFVSENEETWPAFLDFALGAIRKGQINRNGTEEFHKCRWVAGDGTLAACRATA